MISDRLAEVGFFTSGMESLALSCSPAGNNLSPVRTCGQSNQFSCRWLHQQSITLQKRPISCNVDKIWSWGIHFIIWSAVKSCYRDRIKLRSRPFQIAVGYIIKRVPAHHQIRTSNLVSLYYNMEWRIRIVVLCEWLTYH